ncbi:MAG TPA: hypothetical protein VFU99_11475 [Gaiellaceae bacterium]|nr:hypothetical protein [Gaiellaceae bacterium]
MSSELERALRDAREALPTPDEASTARARRAALARLPLPRRRRTRLLALAATMVAAAVVLGVTAGSLNAPPVTAAREPGILGFVPEPGWFALQSPPPAIPGQQTAAVAANVPFASDDVVNGLVEPSGLPYSTLLTLSPDGIVIVMTMTPESEPHVAPIPANPIYEKRELPLRLRDGVPLLPWGAQLRPDQPLAQYQLRAKLAGQNVDVFVYFGTARPSQAQLRAAQRQLSGLVVRTQRGVVTSTPAAQPTSTATILDRTYTCETVILGGIYELRARAHSGLPNGTGWSKLPYAVLSTGGWAGPLTGLPNAPNNSVAWITAGTPSSSTTVGAEAEVFPVLGGGTLGINKSLCRPARAKAALNRAGLQGGKAPRVSVAFDCAVPRRVVVRLRAILDGSASLRERARIFLATNAPVRQARVVVRTPAGKVLAYASVERGGSAQLFTAPGCEKQ